MAFLTLIQALRMNKRQGQNLGKCFKEQEQKYTCNIYTTNPAILAFKLP